MKEQLSLCVLSILALCTLAHTSRPASQTRVVALTDAEGALVSAELHCRFDAERGRLYLEIRNTSRLESRITSFGLNFKNGQGRLAGVATLPDGWSVIAGADQLTTKDQGRFNFGASTGRSLENGSGEFGIGPGDSSTFFLYVHGASDMSAGDFLTTVNEAGSPVFVRFESIGPVAAAGGDPVAVVPDPAFLFLVGSSLAAGAAVLRLRRQED